VSRADAREYPARRGVAAHLTLAHLGPLPAALATLRARGNLNRMIHDTAGRRARLPVEQYTILLRGMAGSRKKAPGVTHVEPLIEGSANALVGPGSLRAPSPGMHQWR
jgi:hypothetical protein